MKKKYYIVIFFFMLFFVGVKNDVYAIEQNETCAQNDITLEVRLDKPLEQYINDNNVDISNVQDLKLTTNMYMLSSDDIIYLKNNSFNLKTIEIIDCQFISDDIQNQFYTTFSDYFEQNDIKKTPVAEDNIEEKYFLSLNGICLINKGSGSYNVGVAYESNDPQVMFRWKQYDVQNDKWTLVSDWNNGNWITWNLKKSGNYWIYVEAKTQDGQIKTSVYGHYYAGLHVKLNGICTINHGDSIDCGVAYDTNDSNITFQWKIYNLQKNQWITISEWNKGNWTTWYPEDKGSYWIYVEAKLSDGNVTNNVIPYYFNGISLELNGMCWIERQSSVDVGVSYSSNSSNVLFKWQAYNLQTKTWELVSNWNKENWSNWNPNMPGDYWLYVEAKTRNGQMKNLVTSFYIGNPKIISFVTGCNGVSWLDAELNLKGNYKDLSSQVGMSRYLVYNGNSWQVLVENRDTVTWKPSSLRNYLFAYEIYDKNSNLIEQSFKGVSIENPYVSLNDILINQKNNLIVDLDISSSTNDSNIQYKWMYYDVSTNQWGLISDWSSNKALQWKAPKTGYFWVHVEAKVHGDLIKTFTKGYTVTQYSKEINDMWNYANTFSSQTNYLILVNRSTHNVGIFYGSYGNWQLDKYWQCSDGKLSTPTVSGIFTVKAKGRYFDSGNSRCYWYTQFYGNYLFHSVLYNKDGTLQDGRLGMGLSHGCVRLDINNAKWIYDYIPTGTKVVVY